MSAGKEPDTPTKILAGAAGGGVGALFGGPLGAALGAFVVHEVAAWLIREGY